LKKNDKTKKSVEEQISMQKPRKRCP